MFRLKPVTLPGLLLALLFLPLASFAATRSNTAADTSLLRFANKYYAINLTASDTTTSPAVMRQAYPNLIVYQTRISVAGSRLNYLRIGFFATKDEARATLATVRSWYPDAWLLQITPLEQTTALGVDLDALAQTAARPAPAVAPPSAPLPPAAKPPAGYALHLDVAAHPQTALPALPPALKGYRLYVQQRTGAQGAEFHLNLGVFADRDSAEQARANLLARYPQAVLREITASEKAQVAALPEQPAPAVAPKPGLPDLTVQLPAAPVVPAKPAMPAAVTKPAAAVVAEKPAPIVAVKPAAPEFTAQPVAPSVIAKPAAPIEAAKPVPGVVAIPAMPEPATKPVAPVARMKPAASGTDATERQARALLDNAQDQIIARQFDAAVKNLAEILTLPENIHTADAMEYTGLAYDQAGKIQQAIQSYQNYLRVYPDSRSGYRIRQRLQTLHKGKGSSPTAAP